MIPSYRRRPTAYIIDLELHWLDYGHVELEHTNRVHFWIWKSMNESTRKIPHITPFYYFEYLAVPLWLNLETICANNNIYRKTGWRDEAGAQTEDGGALTASTTRLGRHTQADEMTADIAIEHTLGV